MYYLMNKDNVVASFSICSVSKYDNQVDFKINHIEDNLPYSFISINDWIDNRSAAKHSKHLERVMKQLGCCDREGFIRLTHAASINDTFWIKSDEENITWNHISLYRNQFTETISRLAFEGMGLYTGDGFSETTPELTVDGHFKKCFIKERNLGQFNSDIFIYKRGWDYGEGLEPYCEVLSSEIASVISPSNSVKYELVSLHNKIASKCNLFTDEQYGYASFLKIGSEQANLEHIFDSFIKIGSEQEFREMMVIDSLCLNRDRHKGNFGVMIDNDTMEIVKMAPIFDFNLSLCSYMPYKDLSNIDYVAEELLLSTPRLGKDFTEIGQLFTNEYIRLRLRELEDFKFTFRGDCVFSEERVCLLEKYIQLQARALLDEKKMFVSDVFNHDNLENLDILDKTENNTPNR